MSTTPKNDVERKRITDLVRNSERYQDDYAKSRFVHRVLHGIPHTAGRGSHG